MLLFDAHCHLHDEQFKDRLPAVMARAHAAGVERIGLERFLRNVKIAMENMKK